MVNKKISDLSVEIKKYTKKNPKKLIIVGVFLFLALLGLILSRGVKINYNLSDYLGKDTETSIALEIMTEEFGMTGNVQVMLSGIDKPTAKAVKEELSSIEGALNVSFDEDSPSSYDEATSSALFTILIDGEDHSDTAKAVIEEIKVRLGDKYGAVELGGSTIEYNALRENTGKEMGLIIVLSISMAAALLLITASSWIEPLILLACSGIAIAINMGLNLFLGEISYITNSVSSILQLALSVDYSIVLLHAYRDEKKLESDSTIAMRRAVKAVFNPVAASALTTIAGLVALLFMSFTIGFDIGIVLIKGIVISAVSALTFLPVVVLLIEKLIQKTAKRAFVPDGEIFSRFAFKANKVITPVVAFLILIGAVLQSFNTYGFTDSIGSNEKIEKTFGRNDSIVLVYKTGDADGDYRKELVLRDELLSYQNSEGKTPLASYTAYSTTVREIYDLKKAIKVLGLGEGDVKMLFSMYNIYNTPDALMLTPKEFVRYTYDIMNSDPDVVGMIDQKTKDTIKLLYGIGNIMPESLTADELITKLNDAAGDGIISDFAIKQMYGLYHFDKIENKKINAKELCLFLVDKINSGSLPDSFSNKKGIISALSLVASGNLSYEEFHKKYGTYGGSAFSSDLIQQAYIIYFVDNAKINGQSITDIKIGGRELIDFIIETSKTNSAVKEQLTEDIRNSLDDLVTVDAFLTENTPLDYLTLTERMNRLQSEVKSVSSSGTLDSEKISGVYIKYAVANETTAAMAPIEARDLVTFIKDNMRTNALLANKMTSEHHAKVEDAEAMIAGAGDLFIGDSYSRALIGVRLPAEGPEMVSFIEYLIDKAQDIFGDDAHITGKVVSTYDLQAAFDLDNLIITFFTIISIFLVILAVFKSLSLPLILVLVIQGAIWISLSLCFIGGGLVFFMSYIVTTCILMGATVDYGILMSNNYLVYRKTMDKDESLKRAVDSAMPTVFTSGLILVVCGFVISLISSQNSIASVGTLLAQGTLVSIVMITVGLPSILYLLDKYILKFTMNDEQTAIMNSKIDALIVRLKQTKAYESIAEAAKKVLEKLEVVLASSSEKLRALIEEKKKQKIVKERLARAKEKRAKTLAEKKRKKEEALATMEEVKTPRKTARSILKDISVLQEESIKQKVDEPLNETPSEPIEEKVEAEETKVATSKETSTVEMQTANSSEEKPKPKRKPAAKKTAAEVAEAEKSGEEKPKPKRKPAAKKTAAEVAEAEKPGEEKPKPERKPAAKKTTTTNTTAKKAKSSTEKAPKKEEEPLAVEKEN